jgi:uncharacterized damage-inducible protein DinB
MRAEDVAILFDYMYWVNGRLVDTAGELDPDAFVEPTTVTTRSLRATLVHELDVEWSWRQNLLGLADEDTELEPEDYPDVRSLADRWQRDENEMRGWIGSLSDHQLDTDTFSAFTEERRPLWQFLLHIVMHAAQQQADAATLLSLAGHSPGELSFLHYLEATEA